MYKVLIVDDESIIVEGLARLVPWQQYNCQVCATAYDAAQGAKLIEKHQPHILFTDIRMPDGNGLTMLAGLRSSYPNMQVTVLTGYRDFDYAQKALRLGVCRFLLKPSKMEELEEALASMTAKLAQLGIGPDTQATPATGALDGELEGSREGAAPSEDDAAGSYLAQQAADYIRQRCTEKISLQDVANACYVSQWHLSKLLNRYTGQNFYDILNCARIELAKEMMRDPALRIGDISEKVGYSDTPHFSRIFKKLEGISANEYRNAKLD